MNSREQSKNHPGRGDALVVYAIILAWLWLASLAQAASGYVNTTNQQSTGFQDGTINPFNSCTVKSPNYGIAFTNNGWPCMQLYWQADGYDGTRDDRGTEACSGLQAYKEGWYGFYIYLPAFNPSFVNSYPTNKQAGCAQIFQNGYCGGSWAALMIVTNNSLYLNYRDSCGTASFVKIADIIPRDAWVPVIIHFIASHTNGGMMQVWFDSAPQSNPSYGATNINFGFGTWNADDSLVSTNPLSYKFGQYDYDDGNYTTNETRTSYYGNVCQLVDPIPANALAIVNPGVGSPPGLAARNAGNGKAALSWTAVPGATSYNIYRSLTNGGAYTMLANVAGAFDTDTNLTNGVTYYYVVTATNVNGESPRSLQASATPNVGSDSITWSGGINGDWDIGVSANWRSNSVPYVYLDGDQLLFDNTSSITNVNLADTVAPGSLMVSNNNSSYTFSSSTGDFITGTTSLIKNGSGSLTFSGLTNSFGGGITMNAGTLDLGGSSQSAGTVTLAGGTIQNGTITGTSYILQSGTVSAALAGSGTTTKSTSGTVTLSGNNTCSGATTVNAGTLVLSGNNSSATTAVSVAGSAVLQLAGANAVAASVMTLNNGTTLQLRGDNSVTFVTATNIVSGDLSLNLDVNRLTGASVNQTLTLAGGLNFNLGSAVSAQTLNVTGGNGYTLSLGAISGVGGGTSFTLNPTTASVIVASISLSGNTAALIFSGSGNITVHGAIPNAPGKSTPVTFNQTGTVTLFGTNTYTGASSINSGTVVLNNATGINTAPALGTITTLSTAGAALLLGGTDTGGLTGGINFTKTITAQDTTSGTLVVGGQNTSGINTFSGNVILGKTANTGKSVTLLAAAGGEVDFTGTLMTNGTDTTAGITAGDAAHAGIIKLTGANTYAGQTTVSNGILIISTAHRGGGNFTVNDGENLEVINSGGGQSAAMGSLTLGNAGGPTTLMFTNILSTTIPIINASGTVTVNATNTIQIAGTNGLVAGNNYPLIRYGSLAGAGFSAIGLSPSPDLVAILTNDTGNSWIALKVINPSVNTNPTNITVMAAGNGLKLSWPADHTGWKLQSQTNSLNTGLGTNWVTVSNSNYTNQIIIPMNSTGGGVFYRLIYP